MPQTWPIEAVDALNMHHDNLIVEGRRYNFLLEKYSPTLALGVPWAKEAVKVEDKSNKV